VKADIAADMNCKEEKDNLEQLLQHLTELQVQCSSAKKEAEFFI
jgi:hypothetical protein